MSDYRLLRHPLVRRDLFEIAAHIEAVSGDPAAAEKRVREADAAFQAIRDNDGSGTRLDGILAGYCVRHAGRDNKLSIVFRTDEASRTVFIAHVSFGGRNWLGIAETRF